MDDKPRAIMTLIAATIMAFGVFLFVSGGLLAGRLMSLIIGTADFIAGAFLLWTVYNAP